MLRRLLPALACLALVPAVPIAAQTAQPAPPKTWVDKDTGHRVWRLTDEPNSGGFYFNVNAYTPDHKTMIYTAPDGIHVLDMATAKTRLLVPNPPRPADAPPGPGGCAASASTPSSPATRPTASSTPQTDPQTNVTSVYKADVNTGAIRKLVDLPGAAHASSSINADETLAAGTFDREQPAQPAEYGQNAPAAPAIVYRRRRQSRSQRRSRARTTSRPTRAR